MSEDVTIIGGADDDKAHEFIVRVDQLLHEVFGPADSEDAPAVVIGLQTGDSLILSSNLSPCQVGRAIHDMHDMAVEQHGEYHAEEHGPAPYMEMAVEDAPEDVRRYAEEMAARLGIDMSQVSIREAVETDDLNDEGIAALIGSPFGQGDDEVPQTVQNAGNDDIAVPDLDGDRADDDGMPNPEDRFESGKDNEG